jgi:hypothetical protein
MLLQVESTGTVGPATEPIIYHNDAGDDTIVAMDHIMEAWGRSTL